MIDAKELCHDLKATAKDTAQNYLVTTICSTILLRIGSIFQFTTFEVVKIGTIAITIFFITNLLPRAARRYVQRYPE